MANSEEVKSHSPGSYSIMDMVSSVAGAAEPDSYHTTSAEYNDLLLKVRNQISEHHANELSGILTNPNAHTILFPLIMSYVTDYVNASSDISMNINLTAEKIYQDMAGFSILSPYLKDADVEEINVNAWNAIEVIWSTKYKLLEETFASPQDCVDIIRKMVRIGGGHIDYTNPVVDSYIGNGTRITATLPPVLLDSTGAIASIRKQTFKHVTREKYISMGFANDPIMDFINICMNSNISMGMAGSPGAGKTTFMTCLLRDYSLRDSNVNNRIVTIEEAREIDLTKQEENPPEGYSIPRMVTRVIHFNTVSGENPITARDLHKQALRLNPKILVPAEMRGGEAIEVVEAGLSGIQIVTSFHAWGAQDGYLRILSMCQMGSASREEKTLLQMIIKAFPLMIYIKRDDDGVRRIMEIFEPTHIVDGIIHGVTIFHFERESVEEDSDGKVTKVIGEFVPGKSISRKLYRLLIQNGAKKKALEPFYNEEFAYVDPSDV